VWVPSKIVIVFDHRIPAESEKTATTHKAVREFVAAQGIEHFYDVGRGGICHQVLPENGHVWPGMVLVGTDSHTTTHGAFGAFATGIGATEMAGVWAEGALWFKVPSTLRIEVEGEFHQWVSAKDLILYIIGRLGADGADYRAVEFDGPAIRRMTVASRMVLANLAMEMGAKVAFTPVDETLLDYLRPRVPGKLEMIAADADACYERVIRVDAGEELPEPQIACPHAVDNVQPLSALGEVPVEQAVLGSCTNGRLEDLEVAARIVAGRAVHPRTRLVVIPASQQIYREAMRLGYLETLVAAGAIIDPPGCGPCVGVHQGILAAGETCVSSTNRNFLGRMGSKDSLVYLASPAVVAASAIAGKLAHPESIVKEGVPCPREV
jgi:homoaconitate hydratase family protein